LLKSLRDSFKIPELKKRIIFTLAMIAVYRIGCHIPTPGIDTAKLMQIIGQRGGILGLFDLFSGGALRRFSIFALGIAPYINASIIMQLLIYVIPSLEKMAKEGEEGRKKISQITRYGTVILGAFQALGISFMLNNAKLALAGRGQMLAGWAFVKFSFMVVITLTAGTAFIMWLGERITERGIGNGISLLIFAAIVSRLPSAVVRTVRVHMDDKLFIPKMIILLVIAAAVIAIVVVIQEGQRKIPVQYAKKVVGRKIYGGQSTFIPLRVNYNICKLYIAVPGNDSKNAT